MNRTRIKFCGMTRIEDVRAAAGLGVDAIGLVFTARSRRCVDLALAHRLRHVLPAFVDVVALFMDDTVEYVESVVAAVRPDLLQFHGSEDAAYCARFGCRYLKALGMKGCKGAAAVLNEYPDAAGLLLDGHALGEAGGSGQVLDWSRMPSNLAQQVILAGGLAADNVANAISIAQPWGVDVASGIESAPGIKDPVKMRDFVRAVRAADTIRQAAR